jgi:hypothetical protein
MIKRCDILSIKNVILGKLKFICNPKNLYVAWIEKTSMVDKKWMVEVLDTLDHSDEIFRMDSAQS